MINQNTKKKITIKYNDIVLYNVTKVPSPRTIEAFNHSKTLASFTGNMKLYVNNKTIVIKNILYVPGATNLLSISALVRSTDLSFTIDNTGLTVLYMKQFITSVKESRGLYILPKLLLTNNINYKKRITNNLDSKLWHFRLGHPGSECARLSNRYLQINCSGQEFCQPCIKAKLPKKQIQPRRGYAGKPLERIHLDLVGPINPVSSVDKYKYFA